MTGEVGSGAEEALNVTADSFLLDEHDEGDAETNGTISDVVAGEGIEVHGDGTAGAAPGGDAIHAAAGIGAHAEGLADTGGSGLDVDVDGDVDGAAEIEPRARDSTSLGHGMQQAGEEQAVQAGGHAAAGSQRDAAEMSEYEHDEQTMAPELDAGSAAPVAVELGAGPPAVSDDMGPMPCERMDEADAHGKNALISDQAPLPLGQDLHSAMSMHEHSQSQTAQAATPDCSHTPVSAQGAEDANSLIEDGHGPGQTTGTAIDDQSTTASHQEADDAVVGGSISVAHDALAEPEPAAEASPVTRADANTGHAVATALASPSRSVSSELSTSLSDGQGSKVANAKAVGSSHLGAPTNDAQQTRETVSIQPAATPTTPRFPGSVGNSRTARGQPRPAETSAFDWIGSARGGGVSGGSSSSYPSTGAEQAAHGFSHADEGTEEWEWAAGAGLNGTDPTVPQTQLEAAAIDQGEGSSMQYAAEDEDDWTWAEPIATVKPAHAPQPLGVAAEQAADSEMPAGENDDEWAWAQPTPDADVPEQDQDLLRFD
jgi:hypothetical protein